MVLGVKNPPANSGDADPSLGREDPREKAMATPSSILAWEIPWTEESGGLQSMESWSPWSKGSDTAEQHTHPQRHRQTDRQTHTPVIVDQGPP